MEVQSALRAATPSGQLEAGRQATYAHGVPIGRAAIDEHVSENGPHLFHVARAENIPSILSEGLRPGSELGHYERDDFFRTRPAHVYICKARDVPLVPVRGGRAVLQVDLTRLDPECFDTDEDLARNAALRGESWVSVPTPIREMLPDGSEAPEEAGRLATWAETTPAFDSPAVVAKSLAGGRIAYRGTVPTTAMEVVEMPSEAAARFREAVSTLLAVDRLPDAPTIDFHTVESTRSVGLAKGVLRDLPSLLGCDLADQPDGVDDPYAARRLSEELVRVAASLGREGEFARMQVASAASSVANATYEVDAALGWQPDICVSIADHAVKYVQTIAEEVGREPAEAAARAALAGVVTASAQAREVRQALDPG